MNNNKCTIAVLTCLLISLAAGFARAQTCQSIFPGPVQNTWTGGYVRLNWQAQVNGASANQVYTTDLRDNAGPTNSCTSADCVATGSVAQTGTYSGGYPGGASTNATWNQAVSLAPGNYGSFNHAGGPANGNAIVTLQPGVYTFSGNFTTGNSVQFVLGSAGSVAIFVQGSITLGFQSRVNQSGTNRYFFFHTPDDVLIDNESVVNAVFYSGDDVTVDFQAQVTGSVTARDDLLLEDQSRVFYNSAQVSSANFYGFCTNGPVAPPSPIAEWRLDQNTWSGNAGEILDSSGNNLHGFSVPVSGNHPLRETPSPAVTGDPGTCAYGNFRGTNDGHLRINDPGTNSILDLPTRFSVAVWINARRWANSGLMTIVSKDENFEFHLNNNGQVNWWWGGGNQELTTSAAVPTNVWRHVAITFESGRQVIYINGVAAATHNSTQAITVNNDPVFIGTDLDFDTRNFDGLIDEVKIYNSALSAAQVSAVMAQTHPCPAGPLINRFVIDAGGATASTCAPRAVTITAVDALNNTLTGYTGTISISTSTGHGTWSQTGTASDALGTFTAGASDSGTATYVFEATGADQGSIRLNLSNFHAETLTITVSENTNAVISASTSLTFSQNAFVITSTDALGDDVIAARQHNFQVAMYRRDSTTGNCAVATNYNAAGVKVWLTRTSQDPGGVGPQISPVSGTPTLVLGNSKPATNFALVFVNGVANFRLLASDVGNYALIFQDDSRTYSDQDINGSTASLVARPFGFAITVPGNPQAANANGAVFRAAGANFTVNVQAVGWSSADDANGDGMPDGHADNNPANNVNLADNTFLSRYGAENPVEAVRLTATLISPAGPATPGLGSSLALPADGRLVSTFTNGAGSTSNVFYSEVGIIEITAAIADGSYLGTNATISARPSSKSGYTGRFTPARLVVLPDAIEASCQSVLHFSYMGQVFNVDWGLEAQNVQGARTQNYTGTFAKYQSPATAAAQTSFRAIDTLAPTPLSARLSHLNSAIGWANGTGTISSSLRFTRSATADGPWAQLNIGVTATDTDGVTVAPTTFDLDSDNNASNDSVNLGQTEVRFGRLRLNDAFGPETANLPVNFVTEYWQNNAWVSNPDDSCTAIALSAITYPSGTIDVAANRNVTVGGGTSTGTYTSLVGGTVNFTEGSAGHYFTAPGAGNTGVISVDVDLTLYPWLRFDWNQDGDHSDTALPTANYTFGSYRGHDRVIFWQEILENQ